MEKHFKNVQKSALITIWVLCGLTTTFIILKLLSIINWSWLLVLSPLWIFGGITLLFIIVLGFIVIFEMYNDIKNS